MERTKVFITYSRRDSEWLELVLDHLAVLERRGLVTTWSDTRIDVGATWRTEIDTALIGARLAVALVSPAFLASRYIWENEMPEILRHVAAGMALFPLIVRPCAWQLEPALADRQVRPSDARALSTGSDAQVDLDLAAFAHELADVLGHGHRVWTSGANDRASRWSTDRLADRSWRASPVGNRSADEARMERPALPRNWSGIYNDRDKMLLEIATIEGNQFRGIVRYRGENHGCRGSFGLWNVRSPSEDAWRQRGMTKPTFAVRFVEDDAKPSTAEYRAAATAQRMVGSWYSGNGRVADFEFDAEIAGG